MRIYKKQKVRTKPRTLSHTLSSKFLRKNEIDQKCNFQEKKSTEYAIDHAINQEKKKFQDHNLNKILTSKK